MMLLTQWNNSHVKTGVKGWNVGVFFVVNLKILLFFFVILFSLLLLYVTCDMMGRQYIAYINCYLI